MRDGTRRGFIFGTSALAATGLFLGVQRLFVPAFADETTSDNKPGPVTIMRFADDGTRLGQISLPKVRKSVAEWKKQLTSQQFDVTRRAATERAFSRALFDEHAAGIYRCADCDNALFDSSTKFDSGTGWPSFWAPIAGENVREKKDLSYGSVRTEIKCTLCDAHLGHVFTDGPEPTGLRCCMNSVALRFIPCSKA